MSKTLIEKARLQTFNTPGSLGVVKDTIYKNCFWPKLDQPTALFAEGSSGIEIIGPPTPRNVIAPEDSIFPDGTRGDCFFVAEVVTEAVPTIVEVKETATVKGEVREIAYKEIQNIDRQVRKVTELSTEEATAYEKGGK